MDENIIGYTLESHCMLFGWSLTGFFATREEAERARTARRKGYVNRPESDDRIRPIEKPRE